MEEGLTKAQTDVFNAIVKFTIENQYPPTLQELCDMLGKSTGAIQSCLKIMKRKNFIEWDAGKPRTLRIAK